jgi:predicted flap endonuclease-1-like 5' DNA nuclease
MDQSTLVAFVLGILLGALLLWLVISRRQAEQVQMLESSWRQKARHLAEEVGGADQAHEETKTRLRDAQAALAQAREAEQRLSRERDQAVARTGELEQHLEEARAALGQAKARVEQLERELRRAHDAELHARQALDEERATLRAAAGSAATHRPAGIADLPPAPDGAADDLTVIKGVGPVLARRLHELGITSFAQLAALTPDQARMIDDVIDFPGRVERERWIEQARELAAPG